jgi:hypothetical protein
MEWLRWFGRWGDKDRAYDRLKHLRETYSGHGDRVIKLSARTDLARKTAGSTQRAFEFVERAFVAATQEYARIGELLDGLEAGLAKGKVGDFVAPEAALKGLGPKLDELDRHLTTWEAKWSQVPLDIAEAEVHLNALKIEVEQAAAAVGAPLPLTDRLAAMAQHLERTKRVLAEGNPIEAGHLVEDLRLAIKKSADDVSLYVSGAGAITQAEQEIAHLRERSADLADLGATATAHVDAAAAVVPQLRPALAAGKLEQFQADLLRLQQELSAARAALKK